MQPAAGLQTPDALIELQRRTIAEHVREEQAKNWPAVYGTFTPHERDAYYDVVPFHTRFRGIQGVADFYQTFAKAFPDFEIVLHRQHDLPGISILEVQIKGTQTGEYCGIQATGRQASVALLALFLFDKTTGHLNAERIYFDNNTILAQIRGEMSPDEAFDLSRVEPATA
jgi:phosphotransferase system HPr-like phosphotransfer protein